MPFSSSIDTDLDASQLRSSLKVHTTTKKAIPFVPTLQSIKLVFLPCVSFHRCFFRPNLPCSTSTLASSTSTPANPFQTSSSTSGKPTLQATTQDTQTLFLNSKTKSLKSEANVLGCCPLFLGPSLRNNG